MRQIQTHTHTERERERERERRLAQHGRSPAQPVGRSLRTATTFQPRSARQHLWPPTIANTHTHTHTHTSVMPLIRSPRLTLSSAWTDAGAGLSNAPIRSPGCSTKLTLPHQNTRVQRPRDIIDSVLKRLPPPSLSDGIHTYLLSAGSKPGAYRSITLSSSSRPAAGQPGGGSVVTALSAPSRRTRVNARTLSTAVIKFSVSAAWRTAY